MIFTRRAPRVWALRLLAALAPVAILPGGCAAVLGAGAVAATDKTPVDHVYSLVSGKNCSLVRKQRGLTYCVEDEVVLETALHCYPTLGEVTCYSTADPFPGGQRAIGTSASAEGGGAGGQIARTPSKTN